MICKRLDIEELSLENKEKNIYVKELDYGGMSGGKVSPDWWQSEGIPLLTDRYNKLYRSIFSDTLKVRFPNVIIPKALADMPNGPHIWMLLFGPSMTGQIITDGSEYYIVPQLCARHSKFYKGYHYYGLTDDDLRKLHAVFKNLGCEDDFSQWVLCDVLESKSVNAALGKVMWLCKYIRQIKTCAEDIAEFIPGIA